MAIAKKEALTVSELTQSIKLHLQPHFTHLKVRGEVTNLRKQASGHYYFSLKDEHAQVAAALFRGNRQKVSYLPEIGDQVLIEGTLNVYAPKGTYQIIVHEISHFGLGALFLQLHQLKLALEKRGWLDPAHKKPLPPFPKAIGVVTSPTGAVIRDIISVLQRRFPHFHLILRPVQVQGEGAAQTIQRAIDEFNTLKCADVLIVGRGGGSLEDLWPFNEESVAAAIFRSDIPIISAVGHETDVTITDYVADVRAPTPSVAAELVVKELCAQIKFLHETEQRCKSIALQAIKQGRIKVGGIQKHPLFVHPLTLLTDYYQKLDGMLHAWASGMNRRIETHYLRLLAVEKSLKPLSPQSRLRRLQEKLSLAHKMLIDRAVQLIEQKKQKLKFRELIVLLTRQMNKWCKDQRDKLEKMSFYLKSINPKNLLKKGYCIPFAEKGGLVIMSSQTVKAGDRAIFQLHDGIIKTTINEVSLLHEQKKY